MEMKAWRAVVVVCFRAVFAEVAPRYETSSQVDHSAVLLSTVKNLPSQAAFERLSVSESAASTQVDPLTPTPSTGGAPQHAVNKTAARPGKIKRKLARAPPTTTNSNTSHKLEPSLTANCERFCANRRVVASRRRKLGAHV